MTVKVPIMNGVDPEFSEGKTITLNYHSDPGHGWIEAPTMLLVQLEILDKISPYSYLGDYGQKAYLEEDMDADVLLTALKAEGFNIFFQYKRTDGDSFIRSLPRFTSSHALLTPSPKVKGD